MERDAIEKHWEKKFKISTHTLTWSVTVKHACTAFVWGISTHTLTWSVTALGEQLTFLEEISTHTLTWSVTCLFFHCLEAAVIFQLTRSRGA